MSYFVSDGVGGFANCDTVADKNCITALDARQQIKRNFLEGAGNTHKTHPHPVFDE
jgi:hypothetical protein